MCDASFLAALDALPHGYSTGTVNTRPYGCTWRLSDDKRRGWLYAEALDAANHISFNIFFLKGGTVVLKPCEMHKEKVVAFVNMYRPTSTHAPPNNR